ncbi:hypothetical protein ST201phi2-1p339 [Pseudomonas phage 201phi2-1]|uniref:Uncharacterized protein n=1 Tax=Pseudomonas phage 201phi2-1 TaxID=198110 RepID=B3FJJ9_BP201|nr:hypothetical protein ST201phi2-1p339 [Pseudomonas phage 201phi2-1]ABY63164.1 hypothetical protein 201phi2-1p339 [Pseudomonas phage 201phi2-1]
MWNDPLITPKPAARPPAPKAPPRKPAKKKPKPKPRPKSTAKLEKDLATLKELTKSQGIQLARLGEIVTNLQLNHIDRIAVDT